MSCLLLVVSSLLVNSRQRLGATDPGFDYRHLVWISPGLKAHGYGEPAAQAYLDLLRARTAALPDVKATSQVWLGPWSNLHMGANWMGRQYAGNRVDPQFLDTMGMRLVRGRNFRPGEDGVAIVNEATARVLWPDQDALGKSLPWGPHGQTVIGVVRNASTAYVGNREPLEFYLPPSRSDAPDSVLLVRVSGSPRDVVRRLQDTARDLDARLQPTVQVVTDTYDREVAKASAALAVIGILGTVAILLSVIGLAGLAGYTVAQRTREIGLRIALGARAEPRRPRHSGPDEPSDRHWFRLRRSWRVGCGQRPAERHPDDVRAQCVRSAPIRDGDGVFRGGGRALHPGARTARHPHQPYSSAAARVSRRRCRLVRGWPASRA